MLKPLFRGLEHRHTPSRRRWSELATSVERMSNYLVHGAHSWTVADQLMKKEIILQGMGWGHMPEFLVRRELRQKRLLSIAGKHLPGGVSSIVAVRRHDLPHGPIAARLWRHIGEQAAQLRRSAAGPRA